MHQEQLGLDGIYFEPNNEVELVEKMNMVADPEFKKLINYDHQHNTIVFAESFVELFQ